MNFSSNALLDCLNIDLETHNSSTHPARYTANFDADELIQNRAKRALQLSLLKKFKDDADALVCNHRALELFTSCNNMCADWEPPQEFGAGIYRLFKVRMKKLLSADILDWDLASVMKHGGWGPGASVGADGYDFYTKFFSSKLTLTSQGMYHAYKAYCDTLPNWSEAEKRRHFRLGLGSVKYVPGSKLSFVSKNNTISRVICTEPTLNMFVQKALGNVIESRLKRVYDIDLKVQPDRNRRMARIGSIPDTGIEYCTIDLKSASDTIPMGLIWDAVPEPLRGLLLASRSPNTKLPNGEWLSLNMVSSMGNGFTFPLQTAIFTCAVHACYDYLNVPLNVRCKEVANKAFGVFGDDIVVLKNTYDVVCSFLEQLGFVVNTDKSFNTGLFRESCGRDFYSGVNIRGVYIKSLKTQSSRYVAVNRLLSWSAAHGVPLTQTLIYLRNWCKSNKGGIHFVPLHEDESSGIRIPTTHLLDPVRKPHGLLAYRCLSAKIKSLKIGDGKVFQPKNQKPRDYNPEGLLVAFLGGYVRQGRITLRSVNTPLYRTNQRVTSVWDLLHMELVADLNLTMDDTFGRFVVCNHDGAHLYPSIGRRVSRLVTLSFLLIE